MSYNYNPKSLKNLTSKFGFKKGGTAWNKGLKCPQTSESLKGRKLTKEHIKNLVLAKIKNPTRYWLGKKRPELSGKNCHFYGQNNSGEKNPCWIKDRTKLPPNRNNDPRYEKWIIDVKTRDGWKCKMDNNCSGYVEAHHILPWRDFPEERYNINNGITLCKHHHPHKYSEETRFIPFFQQLVINTKL